MVVIVFDACALIDLDIPQVDLLGHVISLKEKGVKFIISDKNFAEIHSTKIRHALEGADCLEIKKCDDPTNNKISQELEKLKINLSRNDLQVLILAIAEKADLIVTSDMDVYDKIARYKKVKGINYMKPLTTVGLIQMLFEYNIIDSSVFFEKSLMLFKFKEIDNVMDNLSKRSKNYEIIAYYKEFMRERFQYYKDPLVDEYKVLKKEGKISI
jgi:hypothetical protein